MSTELVVPGYDDMPVTKAELEEAIRGHALTASRLPRHYVHKKAALHKVINGFLTERDILNHAACDTTAYRDEDNLPRWSCAAHDRTWPNTTP